TLDIRRSKEICFFRNRIITHTVGIYLHIRRSYDDIMPEIGIGSIFEIVGVFGRNGIPLRDDTSAATVGAGSVATIIRQVVGRKDGMSIDQTNITRQRSQLD